MNGYQFFDRLLNRLPGWPTERQWVTMGLFAFALVMLQMATNNPALWDIKLFEILIQAIILTGILNMVSAFHFAANKQDETRTDNTGKAFDAIKAVQEGNTGSTSDPSAIREGDEITLERK